MLIDRGSGLRSHPAPRIFKAVLALLLAWGLIAAFTPSVAKAQSSSNLLTISSDSPTVQSGENATFTISFSCNTPAGCGGATITMPFPSVVGDAAVPLDLVSAHPASGGQTLAPVIDRDARTISWTLADNVTVGTSSAVSFVVHTYGLVTPNNTQVVPTAEFALQDGSQVVTATVNTPLTITASPRLNVDKELLNTGFAGGAIPIGGTASYRIVPWSSSRSAVGVEHFRSLTVHDVLPAGSELVSATLADGTVVTRAEAIAQGLFDESTRTFTWPEFNQVTVSANGFYSSSTIPSYYINVSYPNGSFSNGDVVTNEARVTATSMSNQQTDAEGSVSHSLFLGEVGQGSGGSKGPGLYDGQDIYSPTRADAGSQSTFTYSFTNRNTVQQQLLVADSLPCFWASPDSSTDCDSPFFEDVYFEIGSLPAGGSLQWWTDSGETQSYQIPAVSGTSWLPFKPTISDGSTLTRFELRANLDPGMNAIFHIHGTVSLDIPQLPATNIYKAERAWAKVQEGERVVENCLETSSGFYSTDGTTLNSPLTGDYNAQAGRCGYLVLNPVYPRVVIEKYMASVNSGDERLKAIRLANGDSARVRIQITADNSPTVVHPIITDLLPAGVTFVPDSVTTSQMGNYRNYFTDELPDDLMKVEVIDNYNNTGRQLVRISWPGAPGIRAGGTEWENFVDFQVELSSRMTSGNYQNEALAFDENYLNYNDSNTNPNICNGSRHLDSNNLRGLETPDPNNYGCDSSAYLNVQAVAAMNLVKTVQNISTNGPVRSSAEWQDDDGDVVLTDEDRPLVRVNNGEVAEFKLHIENSSSIDLTNILVYDILPFPGDTGTVMADYSRNSESTALLANTDTLEALKAQYPGLTVEYSTSTNPCRGELLGTTYGATTSGPTDCVDDWSETPPADLDDVYGLRFNFGSYHLEAGESIEIPIQAFGNSETGGVAWNSFAAVAREVTSAGTAGNVVLPTETETVGLTLPALLSIEKDLVEVNGEKVDLQDPSASFVQDGDELTWRLKAQKNGPGWATILRVEDKLAEVLKYTSFTVEDNFGNPVEGVTYDADAGVLRFPDGFQLSPATGDVGDTSAPNSVTILLRTTLNNVQPGQQVCNTATVYAAERADVSDDVDTSCVTVGVNVSGTVWDDPNQDGNIDNGELRLSGVTVELRNSDNEVVATTTTNEQGFYEFRGVPSGNYSIHPIDIPERYVIDTYDPDGVDTPRVTEITVVDKDVTEQNFGVTYSDASASASIAAQAEVVNIYKWNVAKTLVSSSIDADNHPVSIYDITPSVSLEQDSSTYVATVTVTNEGTRDALTASLSEVSSEFAEKCTVQGESQVEIPAGQSHDFQVECTFGADRTEFGEDTLSYKVEFPDRSDLSAISGSLTVDIDVEYQNQTVEATDPQATADTRTYAADGDLSPWRVTWVDTTQVVPASGCIALTNTALLKATDGGQLAEDQAVAHICSAQVSGHVFIDETEGHTGTDLETAALFDGDVLVELLDANGNVVASQKTQDGQFSFTELDEGTYQVRFTLNDALYSWSLQAQDDAAQLEQTGETDAGVQTLNAGVRTITTSQFALTQERNNIPNIDAAVWDFAPVTPGEGDNASSVDVKAAFGYNYRWSIAKEVDQNAAEVPAGEEHTANYTVTVQSDRSLVVGDATAAVTVAVHNGEIRDAQLTSVSVEGFGQCTLNESISADEPYTVEAGQTATLTADCVLQADELGGASTVEELTKLLQERNISVDITQADVTAQPVAFTLHDDDPEVGHDAALDKNATARVTDSLKLPNGETIDQVLAEAVRGEDALNKVVYTYSQQLLKTGSEPEEFVNTATVDGGGNTSTTVTLTEGEDPTPPAPEPTPSSSAAVPSSSEAVPSSSAAVPSSSEAVPSLSESVPSSEPSASSPVRSLARTGASVLMVVLLAAALCGLGLIFISRRIRDNE